MSTTDNIQVLYRNWIDGATLSASSQALPAARVKDFRPGRVWRATGCATEWVQADLGASKRMTHASIVAHNLDQVGTIRVRVSDSVDMSSPSVDETVEAWPCITPFGSGFFGESLGGYPVLTEDNDYRAVRIIPFPSTVYGRYVRFDFANPDLAAGYVEAGRLGAHDSLQTTYNFAYDWSWEWDDPSEITETQQSVFVTKRTKRRVLKLSLPWLTEAEAYGKIADLKRIIGKSRDLIVIPFPSGTEVQKLETTVYGMPLETAGISNPYFQLHATSLTVRELVK